MDKKPDDQFLEFSRKLARFRQANESYFQGYQSDPLARLLIGKLKMSPLKSTLLGLAVVVATYAMGVGVLFATGKGVAGITKTGIDIIYDFSLIPLVYGYYVWMSTRPMYVFLKLNENNVATDKQDEYDQFVHRSVHGVINHPLIYLFSISAALGVAAYHYLSAAGGSNIWGDDPAVFWIFYFIKIPVTWMLAWYMTCVIVLKAILSTWRFRLLLTQSYFQIDVANRDAHGGLKPLIGFSINISYFIVACGAGLTLLVARGLTLEYFQKDLLVHLALFLYLAVSFWFFYLALNPIQSLIKKTLERIDRTLERYKLVPRTVFTLATVCRCLCLTLAPVVLLLLLF